MTPSERIKQLCEEALANPEISVTERREPVRASAAAVSAPAAAAPAPARAFATAPQSVTPGSATPWEGGRAEPQVGTPVPMTEQDQDLAAMLEEREGRLQRKRARVRMVVNILLLLIVVGPTAAVAVNPGLRAKFNEFVMHLQEGMQDVKQMGNMKESYDEALGEIAGRGDAINDATLALGVDPDSVSEDDDLEMTAEMEAFMGEEAKGFGVRKNKLAAMGRVASAVSGMESTSEEDARRAAEAARQGAPE